MSQIATAATPRAALHAKPALEASRPIPGIERLMLRLGETMCADLVVGRVAGPIDVAAFEPAAAALVRRHPTLRLRVEGDPPARFVYLDEDRAPLSVEISHEPWQALAVRETTRPFALAGGAPCRFVLSVAEGPAPREAYVIVSAPHALVDGRCLMRLLDELLRAWDAAMRGEDAALPVLPITPAATSLIDHPLLYRLAAPVMRRAWLAELRAYQRRPPLAPRGTVTRDGDVVTLATFREGTPAGWARLKAACRAHEVTVGGALLAASWLATARLVHDQRGAPPRRLVLDLDVDLRGRVDPPVPDTHVGFYTGLAAVGGAVAPGTDFWALARRLRKDTTRALRWRMPELVHLLPEPVADYFRFAEAHGVRRYGAGGTGSVTAVSNVGRYPYEPVHAALRLTGIWGLNGTTLLGPALISWLRFLDGKLFYNAIGAAPAVDQGQLERFQDAVFDLLERAPDTLTVEAFCAGRDHGSR